MSYMDVHDRPDLVDAAAMSFDNVIGVFTQADTWDVHLFVLCDNGDHFYVWMLDVRKPSKTSMPDLDEIVWALENGITEDESEYRTLAMAFEDIVQYGKLVSDNERFTSAVNLSDEVEKVARMSKYARKQFLRERDTTLDAYLAALPAEARNAYYAIAGV